MCTEIWRGLYLKWQVFFPTALGYIPKTPERETIDRNHPRE